MNWDDLIIFLKNKTGLGYYNSNKTEIICRCPMCEINSIKTHGHLYIYKNESKTIEFKKIIPTYHCFKCKSSGTIIKFFKLLKESHSNWINSKEYTFENIKIVKQLDSLLPNNKFIVENIITSELDRYKLEYFYNRLPYNIDINSLNNVIINIKQFIETNNIQIDIDKYDIEFINNNYIGFLYTFGTILSLRCINDKYKRYIKIPLNNNTTKINDFYSIYTKDINETISTIVMGEGVFDILNFYFNDISKDFNVNIYVSCGMYYKNTILPVLRYITSTYSNIIILSDNNLTFNNYIKMGIKYLPYVNSCKILWNKNKKDFGENPITILEKKLC